MNSPSVEGFLPEQVALLSAPLDPAYVRVRDNSPQQRKREFSYIEGWHAIAEANRIFGFDSWQREVVTLQCVSEKQRTIGKGPNQKDGWGVTYIATVRITVNFPNRCLIREGSGAGHGIDADPGQAHESALKEAETDAMKRALMTFGNPFGLALYDREQRNVGTPPVPTDLVEAARSICHQAGLTDVGIRAFADRLSRGATEELGQVAAETLQQIVQRGPRAFSPETIAACNGDEHRLV